MLVDVADLGELREVMVFLKIKHPMKDKARLYLVAKAPKVCALVFSPMSL